MENSGPVCHQLDVEQNNDMLEPEVPATPGPGEIQLKSGPETTDCTEVHHSTIINNNSTNASYTNPNETVIDVVRTRRVRSNRSSTIRDSKEFRKITMKLDIENLTPQDVKCGICFEIFVEPVTYPCGHSACLECHKEHIEKASLQCPFCRTRLSVWNRSVSKTKGFVNTAFWEKIKETFSDQLSARLNGEDNKGSLSPLKAKVLDGVLAGPGEILEDFEREQEKLSRELAQQRELQELASIDLIKTIQENEGPFPEVQSSTALQKDLELAKRLQAEFEAEAAQSGSKKPTPGMQMIASKSKQQTLNFSPAPFDSRSPNQEEIQSKTLASVGLTGENLAETGNAENFSLEMVDKSFTTFSSPVQTVSNASISLEEPKRPEDQLQVAQSMPTHDRALIDEDYQLALKLQAEEEAEYKRLRLLRKQQIFENSRVATRSKTKSAIQENAPGVSQKRKKRQRECSSSSSTVLQTPKRSRSTTSSVTPTLTQRTLDNFVVTSSDLFFDGTPLCTASPSRCSTPDSISAETNRHFTPIICPPKTPPKLTSNGQLALTIAANLPHVGAHKNLSAAGTESNGPSKF